MVKDKLSDGMAIDVVKGVEQYIQDHLLLLSFLAQRPFDKRENRKYRFVKDEVGYTGHISIDKPEEEAAHKVLADYKTKSPDTKDMCWE